MSVSAPPARPVPFTARGSRARPLLAAVMGLALLFSLPQAAWAEAPGAAAQEEEITFSKRINNFFEPIVEAMNKVLFWDPFAAFAFGSIYDRPV